MKDDAEVITVYELVEVKEVPGGERERVLCWCGDRVMLERVCPVDVAGRRYVIREREGVPG